MTQSSTADGRLIGSRDALTGDVYFPARPLSADGSLRATETLELSGRGTLYSWTRFAGTYYGQVDLPEGVRIQSVLEGDPPEIGATYQVIFRTDEDGNAYWRFARV